MYGVNLNRLYDVLGRKYVGKPAIHMQVSMP